jgi:methoxymalonate biosynthesis acyl carrier protein
MIRQTTATGIVEHRVLAILQEGLDVEVGPELDVIDSGLLDSLTFVDLVVRLEIAFDTTIDVESVELDDFRSARAIVGYLARHHQIVDPPMTRTPEA